ncbi:MinD-like ATPase involved in chromosome partitioning or flagellar assembly [Nakamurella sp. UYEF19]|uniref:hypothetical protein n=1 Tax=Nakamurella sp. UYEF19 TaxID=1756392 RepID=UPI00339687ED
MSASEKELAAVRAELTALAATWAPSLGSRFILCGGRKGGGTKTTAASAIGMTAAPLLAGKTVGVDLNPDGGTLLRRAGGRSAATTGRLVQLAQVAAEIGSPIELDRYFDAVGRFFITHNDDVPENVVQEVSFEQVSQVFKLLRRSVQLTIADGGTSSGHQSFSAALPLADQLVLAYDLDPLGLKLGKEATEALQARGFGDLVSRATVMLTARSTAVRVRDYTKVIDSFGRLCGHVQVVEFDKAAAQGAINWEQLRPRTQVAFGRLTLAALRGALG